VIDARSLPAHFSLQAYAAVIVGSSIHMEHYQEYIRRLVAQNHEALNRMQTAFFSVCLTEAYPDPVQKTDLEPLIATFLQKTQWHPQNRASFAGALIYSKYGFLKRFFMRRVARRAGITTDPSHDYEFTDWEAVTRFAENFAISLRPSQEVRVFET
jgi:menaquinone-dependent protoporphyrinogen oxidase